MANVAVRSFIAIVFTILSDLGPTTAEIIPTDPNEARARQLWTQDRLAALIHVKWQKGSEHGIGTAVMVSERLALTAAHVSEGKDALEFRISGPGASPLSPKWTKKLDSDLDISLVELPSLTTKRLFLALGAPEDVALDPFFTFYGFGGDQPGRHRAGSIGLQQSRFWQMLANGNADNGDSGAPILDREGRLIGILASGSAGTVVVVPLRLVEPELRRFGIFMPLPRTQLAPNPSVIDKRESSAINRPVKYSSPAGYFIREGNKWLEFQNGNSQPFATFEEKGIEGNFVILFDASRDMYLKIPINGGFAVWSPPNPIVWSQVYFVSPVRE